MKRNLAFLCIASLLCFSAAADVQVRASRINHALAWGVWGDFNGDGLDDVLRWDQLQWNLGGRLSAPVPSQFAYGTNVVENPVDLNNDRFADLIVSGPEERDTLSQMLFLGDGHGAFIESPLGNFGRIIRIADFTSDGSPDLLTHRPGKLSIIRNDGAANFTLHQELKWTENNVYPDMAVGDLNGDGTNDFAIAGELHLYVYYSNTDGFFGEPRVRFTRRHMGTLAIGDVTGDARRDLTGLHVFSGKEAPTVLTGDGAGRFPSASRLAVQNEFVNDSMVIGDFVAGGAKEIAYAEPNGTVHIVSAAGGQLRELGSVLIDADVRPWVDNIGPRLSVRRFEAPGREDLLIEAYSMDVFANPPRRVWHIDVEGSLPATANSRVRGRTRAVAGFADRIDGEYRVDIVQTNCPIALPRITIDAEGMFVDVALDERIRAAEAVFVDGALWIKMTIVHEGVARELSGTLRTSPEGGFAGTLYEDTQSVCGNWPAHKVVLTSFR